MLRPLLTSLAIVAGSALTYHLLWKFFPALHLGLEIVLVIVCLLVIIFHLPPSVSRHLGRGD